MLMHGSTFVATAVQQILNSVNMPFNMLNGIGLGSIQFNKLPPLVERRQPIVFEFGVTWLGVNIQHGGRRGSRGCFRMEL